MGNEHDHYICAKCKEPIPDGSSSVGSEMKVPCPKCGPTKHIRQKFATCNIETSTSMKVDAQLVISWQEVDRLVGQNEYAAALLVAAINVDFTLRENLRRFEPSDSSRTNKSVMSLLARIDADKPVMLGGLLIATEFLSSYDNLNLSPTWNPIACIIKDVRNKIAHERGFFARLTKLQDTDWPASWIRKVLEDAKAFCHENAC